MNKIIDGKLVSLERMSELKKKVSSLSDKLTLVDISVGNDKSTEIYVKQKEKMAYKIGYDFLNLHYDNIKENDLIDKINELNNDPKITGIIVQLPLPSYLNTNKIINSIDSSKDVDGLTCNNTLKLINNQLGLRPCTPKGIITLLNYYEIDFKNKKVVIIGRSNLVGKPLFNMLLNQDATVTLCHSKTLNLSDFTKDADILIVACGKPKLINSNMIKDNCIIIDVGINYFNNSICGDVDFDSVYSKVKMISKVPGGVGPMTVISLMENVFDAYKLKKD